MRTKKQDRADELARARTNMIPYENGPAMMDYPTDRISYLRGLKNLRVSDKIALLLSDGKSYSGHQIMQATNEAWSWNQRKNDTLPKFGFFTETLPQGDNQDESEYHYKANVFIGKDGVKYDGRSMGNDYCNNVLAFINRKMVFVDKILKENLDHPDMKITDKQRNTIHFIRKQAGWDHDQYRDTMEAWTGVRSCKELSKKAAQTFIDRSIKEIPNLTLGQ